MIKFLFVLDNFLEDPSIIHFCDVGIIKDYPHPHHPLHRKTEISPIDMDICNYRTHKIGYLN